MVRERAVEALCRIGSSPERIVPALVQALHDPEDSIRARAALALGRMQPDPKSVVPLLESALLDDEALVRKAAAVAVSAYGPQARSAVPILLGLMQEQSQPMHGQGRHEFVVSETQEYDRDALTALYWRSARDIAVEALRKIDPQALDEAVVE